jgi:hypothetical protein
MPDTHTDAPACAEVIEHCPYCEAPDFWWLLIKTRRGPSCAYCGAPDNWRAQLTEARGDD